MRTGTRCGATLLIAGWVVFGPGCECNAIAAESVHIEEITVTARKRVEFVLDVPVAVTVLSSTELEAIGAKDLRDISDFSPGLFSAQQGYLRPGRSDVLVRFRGLSDNTSHPQRQMGSVFEDGVYVYGGVQNLGLLDIERVEVISGPQSSVFGRSTFGGAVNYITRKPGDDLRAQVRADVRSYGSRDVSGSIEGPIIPGLLSARITGRTFHQDGQYRNPAVQGERLGRQNTDAGGIAIRFTPSDNFEAVVRATYAHDHDGAPAAWGAGVPEHNCGPFGGASRTLCGDIPSLPLARIGQNTDNFESIRRALNDNVSNAQFLFSPPTEHGLDRRAWRTSLSVAWDIPALDAVATSVTSFNTLRKRILQDGDLTPDLVYTQAFLAQFDDYAQEASIHSDGDGDWKWGLGASWLKQNYAEQVLGIVDSSANASNYSPPCTLPPISCNPQQIIRSGAAGDLLLGPSRYFQGKILTHAAYGSLDYRLTHNIRAGLELRHQWDEVNAGRSASGIQLEKLFKSIVYRGTLDYKPTAATMLYASVSKGNLPGDFNVSVIDASPSIRPTLNARGAQEQIPEATLMNYEIGTKGIYFDKTLTIDAAAYFMQWRNQQTRVSLLDPINNRIITYFAAAGGSDVKGIELKSAWQATNHLNIEGIFSFSRAKYKEYASVQIERVYGNSNGRGKTLPNIPGHTFTGSVTYTDTLAGNAGWYIRGDVVHKAKIYADDVNLTTLPPSTRVNARLGVTFRHFSAEVYGLNLFDSKVYPFAAPQIDFGAYKPFQDLAKPGWIVSLPEKRVFGLRITASM